MGIVGGGAFDAPAVKPFDSIQLSANSKHFQMGRRGRRPLQRNDAINGLTSVHIPGGMRPEARGISHGLKKCPPDTFSPRLCRGGLSNLEQLAIS